MRVNRSGGRRLGAWPPGLVSLPYPMPGFAVVEERLPAFGRNAVVDLDQHCPRFQLLVQPDLERRLEVGVRQGMIEVDDVVVRVAVPFAGVGAVRGEAVFVGDSGELVELL